MAVRATSSYNTRSNSYSRPSTTQKSSAPSKTSTTKPSSPSSSKAPTPAPKRDTFTYSSPAAKASAAAPKTNTTPKQNTAPKTNNTPKQGITPKQNTAPKTNNTPKQGITPKTPTKPVTSNKSATTPQSKTPTKPTTTNKPATTPQSKTPTKPTTTNKSATTPQSKTPTKPTTKPNTASNKLTNDEYSQLAAKAAGVAISSNGKPAFTSYEQSMKYAEALTNLHKSGINKNSTPQEIAAASVGTTVNKNGTPNISSVSQGQGYGSALKNLKSNPQPNVNQNSNGAKPNNTSSQNNTGNKANINPTGSTKPSGSANANRPANSTNSTSSSNKFTNEEYSKMAAQITEVYTDSNGKTIFISYEQSMKYAQALTNLHNGRIDKNSTPQEIAAASVGIKLDKNGNPIFSNDTQRQNYDIALNVTSQMIEDVSSGAPIQSSGNKVNVNNNSQSTDSTSLSTIYLGKHSEGFESYLRNLEKTYGTQYVFENVFKGDKNKYDPYKRASQITGIPLRGNEPYACGSEGVKAFKAKLYGANNTYVSPKGAKVSSGKVYTTKDILSLNGSTVFVVNDGEVEKGENVTVNIDEELAEIIMTTSNEFNIDPTLIIAVMAHESRFDSEASSGLASGLMQVNDIYFPTYASENKELIESLGGDYTNIYDEAANIVAWGASYSIWVDTYGDNKNSLKALRQGYIKPYTSSDYPDGWSIHATDNANEFMDIKNELDSMIN